MSGLLISYLMGIVRADVSCLGYACIPESSEMPAEACTLEVNNTIYLRGCDDNLMCNFSSGLCDNPPPPLEQEAWPGEPCSDTIPCHSGVCKDNYCLGVTVNNTCSHNSDCEPGLYCSESNCVDQLLPGAGTCYSDFDCVNSAGCNFQVCVSYFSLTTGDPVEGCNEEFSYSNFCDSFACYNGKCVDLIHSQTPLPMPCLMDFDCAGQGKSSKVFFTSCECGLNPSGNSYCNQFPGDPDVRNAKLCLQDWLFGEMSRQCNTERRFADYCIRSFWDPPSYDEFSVYVYRANMYPKLVENDECVQEMLTSFYWDVIYSHDDFAGVLWVSVLVGLATS